MTRVRTPVPLAEARKRALMWLSCHPVGQLNPASNVAHGIWPDTQFRAQGAGGAASRILKSLEKDGMVIWTSESFSGGGLRDWGWQITAKGRAALREMA